VHEVHSARSDRLLSAAPYVSQGSLEVGDIHDIISFSPVQIDFGVPKGMEVAIHAAQVYATGLQPDQGLIG